MTHGEITFEIDRAVRESVILRNAPGVIGDRVMLEFMNTWIPAWRGSLAHGQPSRSKDLKDSDQDLNHSNGLND